jgi:2,3-bisphosphoglycerate-dependent phosphoglycerate mutase
VRLILVRHALPHRVTAGNGVADPGLTELGDRQALRVADALAGEPIEAVYTSPQRRAKATAAPLLDALRLSAEVSPGLAEFDAQDPRYVPVHEMAKVDPAAWERMLDRLLPIHVDEQAFRSRVELAFDAIAAAHPGAATVACFAHAGTINVYLATLLELARPLTFPLDYAGITRVSVSRGGRRSVRTVNEIGHVADLLDPIAEGSARTSSRPTPSG